MERQCYFIQPSIENAVIGLECCAMRTHRLGNLVACKSTRDVRRGRVDVDLLQCYGIDLRHLFFCQ